MNVPTLRPEQHATILGYVIIAYGIGTLIDLIGPLTQAYVVSGVRSGGTKELTDLLWPKIVFGIVFFVLCWAAGVAIKNREDGSKGWGLTIALIAFGFFPLGTIVSAYTLLYLFVIYQGPVAADPQTQTNE